MPRRADQSSCLAEQIRDALADRIVAGRYPPGHRLVELTVAREFGTSQAPVREALRLLAGLRLVEIVPNHGTRVRELGERQVRELILVRGILEEGAARFGAAAHFRAHPKALAGLRADTEAMIEAAAEGDERAVLEHNSRFHRAIVAAAGNATLLEVWETFALRPLGMLSFLRKRFDLTAAARQHYPIISALAKGDGEEAGRLLREHAVYFARLHEPGPAKGRDARRTSSARLE
jgi:DNA-binding GntR family transcriptional regulator